MLSIIIIIAAGVGVATLIGGVALIFRGNVDESLEDRLSALAGMNKKNAALLDAEKSLLSGSLDNVPGKLEKLLARITNLQLLIDQADVNVTPTNLMVVTLCLGGAGCGIGYIFHLPMWSWPILSISLGILPFLWLVFSRNRRMKAFGKQLPEAMELLARGLRAGHSMQAGCQLVADEMNPPIGKEFQRAFEEQNLGVSLEDSLDSMTNRVPNMDLRFFATAVVLQRQTGGDLAEILDKIGRLIRERFKLYGQIQALTGEGRLSGIVLLALPPVLYLVMLKLNYDYAMVLLTDPLGKKYLAFAIVMQLVGAIVIKKIVSIKV
ncbi:MAG TPA: type II secretion system F family protein [Pirellulaceae bacterium]